MINPSIISIRRTSLARERLRSFSKSADEAYELLAPVSRSARYSTPSSTPLVPGGCQQLVSLIENRCMVFLSALLTMYSTPSLSCMKSWPSAIKAHPLLRYHSFPLVYRGYARAIARDATRVITVNTTAFVHGFCVEKTRFVLRALRRSRHAFEVISFSRWVYVSPFLQSLGQTG